MKKKQVNIYLSPEVDEALAKYAHDLGTYKSPITEDLIRKHLMNEEVPDVAETQSTKENLKLQDLLNQCSISAQKLTSLTKKRK
jgi:predicted DNA-binding protein